MTRNEAVIDGRLLKRRALRYTPAGTPVIEILIGHSSIQDEAGGQRKVRCEIEAVAIGDLAVKLSTLKLNHSLQVSGFLMQRSAANRRLVLHMVSAEPVNGGEQE